MKFLLLLLPLVLAGCVTTDGNGSVKGSCPAFQAPQYAIRGATQHDQDWIDPQIESGIGACDWARPKPRPAEWDVKPAHSAPLVKAKKKGSWIWRLKWNRPRPPVVEAPAPPTVVELPAVVVAAPPPPPPPAPRSAIDQLLHPEQQ